MDAREHRVLRALALALLLLGAPAVARAQHGDQPFTVDADEVEYQAGRDLYVARGHAVVRQGDLTITADRILFSNRTRKGVATGDVVLRQKGDVLHAQFIEFDIDTMQGVVFDGDLDAAKGGYSIQGKEVRKTGEGTWVFYHARFTTCRCPNPKSRVPWRVKAQKAQLDADNYGRAHNSTLEILGVPVLWLPYAVYPLRRDRQTGFLFPQVGTSGQSGGEITLPFFWAPRDDVGVLLEPTYFRQRGFKPAGTFEYVFGERGYGQLYGTFIHDKSVDPNDPATPLPRNRWGITFEHAQELPGDSWLGADVAAVSDNQFPFDFTDFRRYRWDRFLESTGLVGTNFGGPSDRLSTTLSAFSADDLQNPNDQDRDNFLLQRLPELSLAAEPGPVPLVPGLVASAPIDFVNFQRYGNPAHQFPARLRVGDLFYDTGSDAVPTGQERNSSGVKVSYDAHGDDFSAANPSGPEGDHKFEEGEPLANQGQRLVAHPRLSYPIALGDVLEVVPEAGYYGTFYQAQYGGTAVRNLFTGRLDLHARLRGAMHLPFGIGATTHEVEPYVAWIGLSGAGQNGNPLFLPPTAVPQQRLRLLELDNVLLDPSDRLHATEEVVVGVTNRWLRPSDGSLLADLILTSGYDFAGNAWAPAVLQGQVHLPLGLFGRFHAVADLSRTVFSDGLVDFGWSSRQGHSLGIRYRYVRDIPQVFENFLRNDRFQAYQNSFSRINQISGNSRVQVTENWALTYAGSFSFENTVSLINQFGVEYLSQCKCWAVRLEIDEDRVRGFSWRLRYRLVGLGDQKQRLFKH